MSGSWALGNKDGPWGKGDTRTGSWKRKQESLLQVLVEGGELWSIELTSTRGGILVLETGNKWKATYYCLMLIMSSQSL